MKGIKHSKDKIDWRFINFDSLKPLVKVLEYGALKYTTLDYYKVLSDIGNKIKHNKVYEKEDTILGNLTDDIIFNLKNKFIIPVTQEKSDFISVVEDNCYIEFNLKDKTNVNTEDFIDLLQNKNFIEKNIEVYYDFSEEISSKVERINNKMKLILNHENCVFIKKLRSYDTLNMNRRFSVNSFYLPLKEDKFKVEISIYGITGDSCSRKTLDILNRLVKDKKLNLKNLMQDGRDNWKHIINDEEFDNSLIRHSIEYMGGKEIDKESLLSHLGHIMANCMFLNYKKNVQNDKKNK